MSSLEQPAQGPAQDADQSAGEETTEALFKRAAEEEAHQDAQQAAHQDAQEEERVEAQIAEAGLPDESVQDVLPIPSPAPPEEEPAPLERMVEPEAGVARKPRRRRPPSLFWPFVLVGAGVVLLLSNLGYLPVTSWSVLWRLWPLLLIGLGVDALIGRRSAAGAAISGVLILLLIGGAIVIALFAHDIPALVELAPPVELQVEHVEYPLAGVRRAAVDIDWTSLPGYLGALRDSNNLIEGDVAYRGTLIFEADVLGDRADVKLDQVSSGVWFGSFGVTDRQRHRWNVNLSPDVVLDLALDAGSGHCEFDLTDLQVSDLFLDVGSGGVNLTLPSESSFEARIDGGSGRLNIDLPRSVGARVILEKGSGAFRPDERFRLVRGGRRDDGVWETDNLDSAEYTVELRIDQGSGSVHIG